MAKHLKITLVLVFLFVLIMGGVFAWYAFHLYPAMKPMRNWDRAATLSLYLSQVTKDDFKALHLPLPTTASELPTDHVRLLCDRLYATGRFPDFKPGSELKDYYGNSYVVTVRLPDTSSGHWVASGGFSGPKDFVFGVCSPGHTESIEH
ncbi:hypothetical protein BH09VER1_BH09VER1_40300 [soil metagenome]